MGFLRKLFNKDTTTDVLELLTSQHSEMDELFAMLEKGEGNRAALFTELADMLAAHSTAEEKVFYPAIMSKDTEAKLQESVEEHLAIKRVLADLISMKLDDDMFVAKLKVLKEQVAHHAHEEEEKDLFPKVKDMFASHERAALGNEVLVMFEDLMLTHPYKTVPAETAFAAKLPPVTR
ncbi:MAG: hemerythrin domain-containing protein [Deltaproteobacteria bacterium]|nr:hemerythrin domain-containing protein [Deltaproteobacteria bacterium]